MWRASRVGASIEIEVEAGGDVGVGVVFGDGNKKAKQRFKR